MGEEAHAGTAFNLLLASMSKSTIAALLPQLDGIPLPLGATLYQANVEQHQVYFPTSGIVSLIYTMVEGETAEIAIVGLDGVVGLPAIMGGRSTTSSAVVQVAGFGYRVNGSVLANLFQTDASLRDLLLRYMFALSSQMSQTAVCNRHHSLIQQFCRWILLSLDRLASNEVRMTQQLIANMLGVRREGVSAIAGELKAAGLIDYSRGQILVLDRAGLEARACECYRTVVTETERLLPRPKQWLRVR